MMILEVMCKAVLVKFVYMWPYMFNHKLFEYNKIFKVCFSEDDVEETFFGKGASPVAFQRLAKGKNVKGF